MTLVIHGYHVYHVAKDEIGPLTLFFTDFYAKLESAPSSTVVVSIKEKDLTAMGIFIPHSKLANLKAYKYDYS